MSAPGSGDDSAKDKSPSQGGEERKSVADKKITISEIAKSAFGEPAKLPKTEELPATEMPQQSGSGNAPAFGRLVQDYLAHNPGAPSASTEDAALQSLEKAFQADDFSAVIDALKSASNDEAREQLCKQSSELTHKLGKLTGLTIIGFDEERNALKVQEQNSKEVWLVDSHGKIID